MCSGSSAYAKGVSLSFWYFDLLIMRCAQVWLRVVSQRIKKKKGLTGVEVLVNEKKGTLCDKIRNPV